MALSVTALIILMLGTAMSDLHVERELAILREKKLQTFFNILDLDKNNKVELSEMINLLGVEDDGAFLKPEELRAILKLSKERVNTIFEIFDENEDHLLDKWEVIDIFQILDINGNKAITFSEFVQATWQFAGKKESEEEFVKHDEF